MQGDKDDIEHILAGLSIPQNQTDKPVAIVVAGLEERSAALFEGLREFFPLVYISQGLIETIPRPKLLQVARALAERGACPFVAVGDLEPPILADLAGRAFPLELLWAADCSENWPSRAGADRMEWLKTVLDVDNYYLVDTSLDIYPQVFSLPFLPGPKH